MENISKYLEEQQKIFALYTLNSRAIPYIADGLKAAARRVLWTARSGKKFKSATLAGATMPIHPHASPDSTINTLAAPYGNNIPLLDGDGAFGTLLNPTAYGASRYTSVSVSKFTQDVVFRDIEIVPLVENYDGTLEEPKYFLPIIPTVLLNPQDGIAVGFASSILPRSLPDIIQSQIRHLEEKTIKDVYPKFLPTNNVSDSYISDDSDSKKWVFNGEFERINCSVIRVTNLPYGVLHAKFLSKLEKLEENGTIQEVIDNSKSKYDIQIKFKRGTLKDLSDMDIMKKIGLINTISENLNLIDFSGKQILSTNYVEVIQKFTNWRLEWYVKRYQRLADLLELDIQKYKDIITAIEKNVGGIVKKIQSRNELKVFLSEIGIIHIDYIADLPVYKFTEEERNKVQMKLSDALKLLKEYQGLLKSSEKRKTVYIKELKEVLNNYKKGVYQK